MKRFKVLLSLPFVLMCIGITVASQLPSPPKAPISFSMEDKVLHVACYFVYALTFIMALFAYRPSLAWRQVALRTLLITTIFGLYDEVHQYFVPNRYCDLADWAADILGGVLALFFIEFMRRQTAKIRLRFFPGPGE